MGRYATVMAKEMKRRQVEKALTTQGCTKVSENGPHTKWKCPCGAHVAAVPRHPEVTPGVVRNIIQHLACLPKGWLQ